MKFAYSFYFNWYFLFPAIMVVFSTTSIVSALLRVLVVFRQSGGQPHDRISKVVLHGLFALIVAVILLCVSFSFFQRGGRYLYSEKEDNAVRANGMITQITTGGKYELQITVNDSQYIIATTQTIELKTGEYVQLLYLPQSHFVLELYKT